MTGDLLTNDIPATRLTTAGEATCMHQVAPTSDMLAASLRKITALQRALHDVLTDDNLDVSVGEPYADRGFVMFGSLVVEVVTLGSLNLLTDDLHCISLHYPDEGKNPLQTDVSKYTAKLKEICETCLPKQPAPPIDKPCEVDKTCEPEAKQADAAPVKE
jgi:hypothetical protein